MDPTSLQSIEIITPTFLKVEPISNNEHREKDVQGCGTKGYYIPNLIQFFDHDLFTRSKEEKFTTCFEEKVFCFRLLFCTVKKTELRRTILGKFSLLG